MVSRSVLFVLALAATIGLLEVDGMDAPPSSSAGVRGGASRYLQWKAMAFFGFAAAVSVAELKAAKRKMLLETHPDPQGATGKANAKFFEINEQYQVALRAATEEDELRKQEVQQKARSQSKFSELHHAAACPECSALSSICFFCPGCTAGRSHTRGSKNRERCIVGKELSLIDLQDPFRNEYFKLCAHEGRAAALKAWSANKGMIQGHADAAQARKDKLASLDEHIAMQEAHCEKQKQYRLALTEGSPVKAKHSKDADDFVIDSDDEKMAVEERVQAQPLQDGLAETPAQPAKKRKIPCPCTGETRPGSSKPECGHVGTTCGSYLVERFKGEEKVAGFYGCKNFAASDNALKCFYCVGASKLRKADSLPHA
jgi:hypothetical protein